METVKNQLQRLKEQLADVDLSPPDRAAIYEKVQSLVQPIVDGKNKSVEAMQKASDALGDYTNTYVKPLLRRSNPEEAEDVTQTIEEMAEQIEEESQSVRGGEDTEVAKSESGEAETQLVVKEDGEEVKTDDIDELIAPEEDSGRLSRSLEMIKRMLQRLKDLLWSINLPLPDRAAIWAKILSLLKPLVDGTNGSIAAMKRQIAKVNEYTIGSLVPLLRRSSSPEEAEQVTRTLENITNTAGNEIPSLQQEKGDVSTLNGLKRHTSERSVSSENSVLSVKDLAQGFEKLSAPKPKPEKVVIPKKGERYNGDEAFNKLCLRPFHEQGAAFLNVYWEELGDQADYIFEVAYETFRMADMHVQGITLIPQYEESGTLDEMGAIYFYEKLCKLTLKDPEGEKWRSDPHYAKSMPVMLESEMKRRQQLKEIDVNYDGKLSFIEYLLDQYSDVANPEEFIKRNRPYVEAEASDFMVATNRARKDLDEVHHEIRKYQVQKEHLEAAVESAREAGSLIKVRVAEHNLNLFMNNRHGNELQVGLIAAEAAVRRMKRIAIYKSYLSKEGQHVVPKGNMYWESKQIAEVKAAAQ